MPNKSQGKGPSKFNSKIVLEFRQQIVAGVSTESCSVGGKPCGLHTCRRDRSTPKRLTLLKRKILSGQFGLARLKSALSIFFFLSERQKNKKLIILRVSHLLTHYKNVYGFVTSETRVLRNPSPQIVTSSVFWEIGYFQSNLYLHSLRTADVISGRRKLLLTLMC